MLGTDKPRQDRSFSLGWALAWCSAPLWLVLGWTVGTSALDLSVTVHVQGCGEGGCRACTWGCHARVPCVQGEGDGRGRVPAGLPGEALVGFSVEGTFLSDAWGPLAQAGLLTVVTGCWGGRVASRPSSSASCSASLLQHLQAFLLLLLLEPLLELLHGGLIPPWKPARYSLRSSGSRLSSSRAPALPSCSFLHTRPRSLGGSARLGAWGCEDTFALHPTRETAGL